MHYYKIAVFTNIDTLLTYSNDSELALGSRVIVPLGKKYMTGVVVEKSTAKESGIDEARIKPVKEPLDVVPSLSGEQLKLGLWVAGYYATAPGMVFNAMLSSLHKITSKKTVKLTGPVEGLSGNQKAAAIYLESKKTKKATAHELEKKAGIKNAYSVIAALAEKGVIEVEEKNVAYGIKKKTAEPQADTAQAQKITPNPEQQAALDKINAALNAGVYKTFLLYGITGSGKTEVYIRAAQEAVKLGKQAIILVPEIFLTPQTVERFKVHFESNIALFHSGLAKSERLNEWKKMREGRASVVVGTRSAVFAPFDKIGLIVVDEEFDSSYKQESDPRYSARDTAVYRGSINNAVVVLGSATPSVETYLNAINGKYEMLALPKRVSSRPMPEIQVIDLKTDGNRNPDMFLSEDLINEMHGALEANEQVILFVNRRGFSSYTTCTKCGYVEKCGQCDIPLVYHKNGTVMRCHYCASEKAPSLLCPKCGEHLRYRGVGTQRIEEVVAKFFPDKRIMRVDIDSMREAKEYVKTYNAIKNKEVDILIGTQMIAKGFDFPEVTFVGVVTIDALINMPDFRSDERAFQLLTQVAGRTGRGDKKGRVIIQTYNPDSLGVKYIKNYEADKFYAEQLEVRKQLNYPPFCRLVQVIVSDAVESRACKKADETADAVIAIMKKAGIKGVSLLGPAEAPLFRLRGVYRYSILLKCKNIRDLNIIARETRKLSRGGDITVTVDPITTL